MRKRTHTLALAAWTFLAGAGSSFGWNEAGHRLSVEKAIRALPRPLKAFYETRTAPLVEVVTDPSRFERRMVFEVDRLEAFPFDGIPGDRTLAVRRYGEDQLAQAGDLPWKLLDAYRALVDAFGSRDFEAVLTHSAEIAVYAGELNVPTNVSMSGDGEPTRQNGLRERFDSRLLEVYASELGFDDPSAVYLDRPAEYATSIALKTFIWTDNVLYADYLSRMGVSSYDRFYFEGMWRRLGSLVKEQLAATSFDVSSFWYTAWVEANKPDLPDR